MPSLPKPRLRRSARARVDPARLAASAEPQVESVEWGGLRWVNIERPGPAERAWLEEHYEFHPLDYEDVLSRNQRPKIDEYDDYLFIVLYFPVFDKTVGRLNAAELDIFIGPDFLITIPNTPIPPVEYLFERCRSSEDVRDSLLSKGSGYLLYKIVDDSFDYCFPMLRKIGNKLERMEEEIFEGKAEEVVRDLSNSKQEIINFRKIIRPQRAVLRDLERTKQRYLAEEMEVYFDDIVDASERIWDMLENYKEVVEALEDTNESVLSHRVNEVLRVLTAFSVIILPLTLLASIFGMNVDFPFEGGVEAFWTILGVMVVVLVGHGRLLPPARLPVARSFPNCSGDGGGRSKTSISTPIDGGLVHLSLASHHKAPHPVLATVEIDVCDPSPFSAAVREKAVRVPSNGPLDLQGLRRPGHVPRSDGRAARVPDRAGLRARALRSPGHAGRGAHRGARARHAAVGAQHGGGIRAWDRRRGHRRDRYRDGRHRAAVLDGRGARAGRRAHVHRLAQPRRRTRARSS